MRGSNGSKQLMEQKTNKLRKETFNLMKIYQKEKDIAERNKKKNTYKEKRKEFTKEITTTKAENFQEYITEFGNCDPWNIIYKNAANKTKRNFRRNR